MTIESNNRDAIGLPDAYQSLSAFEKSLVQLASIIYETVNRITFINCLRRARMAGPEGEWLTTASITPYIIKLQDAALLDKDCRCPDELVELVSREAFSMGSYEDMAATVQREIPFSQYQSKWPQRCRP